MSSTCHNDVIPNISLFFIGSAGGPHRRSQSEVPGYEDDEGHGDPFKDITDALPQKYATLPRNRNPFEGEPGQQLWDRADRKEKKEKVSLLERVTGKKEVRKPSNEGRMGSSGDLRSPNPFSNDSQAETNPFIPNYKPRCQSLHRAPTLLNLCNSTMEINVLAYYKPNVGVNLSSFSILTYNDHIHGHCRGHGHGHGQNLKIQALEKVMLSGHCAERTMITIENVQFAVTFLIIQFN